MATNKGLYLQRGLKKEKKSHRKIILLLAVLFTLGVLIAPFLWKVASKSKQASEKASIAKPGETFSGGAKQDIVVGKIPKGQVVTMPQRETPPSQSTVGGEVPKGDSKPSPATLPPTTPSSASPLVASPLLPPKQENIYELRSELRQKEIAEDKKAKETVAQSALSEMPFPSGGASTEATKASSGKHTIVSMLEPEKRAKKKEPPETPSEKTSSEKIPPKGSTASVTKPATPSSAQREVTLSSTSSSPSKSEASYWIQVGAYREEGNAKRVKAIISELGHEAIVKQSSHPKLGVIYVVRVPVKGSKSDAQKLISLIAQKTGDKPFLMESR
ncbi:MAG: SPOR domain-containing protein [Syntrophobacterales bacterium]|nr:SPOR domain-containing protein [Syntrophobacterales bacterium]